MTMMSRSMTAVIMARPRPGTPKACSMGMEPASTKPMSTPDRVMTGSRALGSAWRLTTRRSMTPLARAVRT